MSYKKATKRVKKKVQELPSQSKKITCPVERLTHDEKAKVIKWFVELRSTGDIKALIQEEFDKDINRMSIWRFSQRKKWKPIIARLRAQFEREILKIPIANKAHRLRYLQKIADEGLKWSLKTVTKDGDEIFELKLSAATQAIKEARAEIEGEKAIIDQSTHVHFTKVDASNMSSEELAQDILQAIR